ncbi:MAG: hypothetical protein MUC67_03660 [Acidobacteria bacterium]|jgi:CheY-like chemotaxis protein|nr:hypothetical protein [Acidobacteriota bacterium]
MALILLVHWNAAEAEERAAALRAAGHEVVVLATPAGGDLRALLDEPLDAAVIDLRRVPSQGRDVGIWLRGRKATRRLPLVFVEGDPEKTAAVRALLPDARFTPWPRIRATLRSALAVAPAATPVVPPSLSGYSGKPLATKLGVRAGATVALLGAPEGFARLLEPLPEGTRVVTRAEAGADVVVLFLRSQTELARKFAAAAKRVADGGRLWLAWPKKASGVPTDLAQDGVRAFGLAAGWVDYKIAALDPTWSGLCFARRAARP